jgi:hypothetical protein
VTFIVLFPFFGGLLLAERYCFGRSIPAGLYVASIVPGCVAGLWFGFTLRVSRERLLRREAQRKVQRESDQNVDRGPEAVDE